MTDEEIFLQATDVSFNFGKKELISGLSLTLTKGIFGALLGQNGAGKSTLMKILSGYLAPSKGKVTIGGKDVHQVDDKERSRLVTYVGDSLFPSFDFTVEETVAMGRIHGGGGFPKMPPEDAMAKEKALSTLNLQDLRDRPLTSLSSGEYQRVELARALYQDPEVLLLDEPTAHMDIAYEMELMAMIDSLVKERKKTVLAVFHDLNLALRYASILFFLKNGKIFFSIAPSEVTPYVIRDVFGVQVKVTFDSEIRSYFAIPIGFQKSRPV